MCECMYICICMCQLNKSKMPGAATSADARVARGKKKRTKKKIPLKKSSFASPLKLMHANAHSAMRITRQDADESVGKVGEGCKKYSEERKNFDMCLHNGQVCGKPYWEKHDKSPECTCDILKLTAFCSYGYCGSVDVTWSEYCVAYKLENFNCDVECSRAHSKHQVSILGLLMTLLFF